MKGAVPFTVDKPSLLLDFLLSRMSHLSRNSVKNILSRGYVRVDGLSVAQYDWRLSPGQVVTVLPPAEERLPFPVLYEDDGLLVINKPSRMLSVATDTEKVVTAYRTITEFYQRQRINTRLFVVHRLDRDTSGVLLFAKDRALRDALQENWNDLIRERRYYAVVEGMDLPDSGVCRSRLAENSQHKVYSTKEENGKVAVTRYQVMARQQSPGCKHGGYALLDVALETGRKNQIRVHLSELGHPVAGDKKYGAVSSPIGRLALHAYRLSLTDPRDGQSYSFTAPVPAEFQKRFPGRFPHEAYRKSGGVIHD